MYEYRISDVHGYGLFATENIPKGKRIIQYKGKKITNDEADEIDDTYNFQLNDDFIIDGRRPDNIAKYANHSCEPNCVVKDYKRGLWFYAIKSILVGEEINIDYGYGIKDAMRFPCRCGKSKCIGYIIDKNYRSKLKKKLFKHTPQE